MLSLNFKSHSKLNQGNRKSLRIFWVAMAFLGFQLGCSPTVQEKKFQDPKQNFDPRYADTDVLNKYPFGYFDFNKIVTLDGDYSMAAALRISENLISIGQTSENLELVNAGHRWIQKIQNLEGIQEKVLMKDTPFVSLVIAQTELSSLKSIQEAKTEIAKSLPKIEEVLQKAEMQYQWPKTTDGLVAAASAIADFLQSFSSGIEKSKIYSPVQNAIVAELSFQKKWVMDLGQKLSVELSKASKFGHLMEIANRTIQAEKIELSPEYKLMLDRGEQLAKDLSICQNPQAALRVIVDVWVLLDDKQREELIKPVNSSLYHLLKGRSDKNLNCLREEDCKGVLRDLIKQTFVLPQIQLFGVQKICQMVEDQSYQYTLKMIQDEIPSLYQQTPQLIREELAKTLKDKQDQLGLIQADYSGFLKSHIQTWSEAKLSSAGKVGSLELGRLNLNIRNRELRLRNLKDSSFENIASAESAGVGFSIGAELLNSELALEQRQQIGIEMINRLIGLSGHMDRDQKLVPAWLMPLEPQGPILDITQFVDKSDSWTMVDEVQFKNGFEISPARPQKINITAVGQAELLRGVAQMISFFKDWKQTAYEKSLGLVQAQDLTPEFDFDELKRPLFPKTEMLTLSVADAAVILKNITKKFSQFFIVSLNNEIKWSNEYDLINGDPAVMAGVVDIIDGERAQTVKSSDVSRWILAISEFLKASEGIEETKAEMLLAKDAAGRRPLDTLIESRRQLKLLLVGLSNFLSNQLVDKDGLVVNSMTLQSLKKEPIVFKSVLDQALAIRALVVASQITQVKVYQVSAIEIYYKMNFNLFNPKIRFYSANPRNVEMPLPIALEIVRSLGILKPYLPEVSQKQLELILAPWYEGFKTLY